VASARQVQTAKRNVKKAQQAARRKRTIAHLEEHAQRTRQAGWPRSSARRQSRPCAAGSQSPAAVRDRQGQEHPGRSRMGKWDLIEASLPGPAHRGLSNLDQPRPPRRHQQAPVGPEPQPDLVPRRPPARLHRQLQQAHHDDEGRQPKAAGLAGRRVRGRRSVVAEGRHAGLRSRNAEPLQGVAQESAPGDRTSERNATPCPHALLRLLTHQRRSDLDAERQAHPRHSRVSLIPVPARPLGAAAMYLRALPDWTFAYTLEREDRTQADPPTLKVAVLTGALATRSRWAGGRYTCSAFATTTPNSRPRWLLRTCPERPLEA
jgi:hypothetical protein